MQLSIVSYLDAATAAKVRKLQEAVSEITDSKAALYSWKPHITVGDGVVVTNKDELDKLSDEIMNDACNVNEPFKLTVAGFEGRDSRSIGIGEISTPYVLQLNVAVSQALTNVVTSLKQITNGYQKWYEMPAPYIPHVTIAFRDLDEKGYIAGLNYLKDKSFEESATIDHIALVQKLENKDVERRRLAFKPTSIDK